MGNKLFPVSWRETVGMIDAVTELYESDSWYTWPNRYGQLRKGRQYIFLANTADPDVLHENIIIAETEIGIQSHHYNLETNRFNEIDYLPAYRFSRVAGGLSLASVVISHDGQRVIPIVRQFRDMLKPQDIISDLHYIMYKGEEI